jgi:hypothetical protein
MMPFATVGYAMSFKEFVRFTEIIVGGVGCNKIEEDGTCGGYGAYVLPAAVTDGLDIGRDYCASGQ